MQLLAPPDLDDEPMNMIVETVERLNSPNQSYSTALRSVNHRTVQQIEEELLLLVTIHHHMNQLCDRCRSRPYASSRSTTAKASLKEESTRL